MNREFSIAILYRDEADRRFWAPALEGLPGVLGLTVGTEVPHALERLRAENASLRLVALSAGLYPESHPALAASVRDACPRGEIILLAPPAGPVPSLKPLWADDVRHLAVTAPDGGTQDREYLRSVLSRLVDRRPWEIEGCLKPGTAVHSYLLHSSDEKEGLIRVLEDSLVGDGPDYEMLRQKGALLADELLENALYDAPRGADGGKLFRKGEKRLLLPGERIVFSFGFDGETLALKLTDNWGSLEPDHVLECLVRNQEGEMAAGEEGGRGLFIIWRFLDRFHLNIQPGQETTVGGQLQLSSGLDMDHPRGFHITELEQGDAA